MKIRSLSLMAIAALFCVSAYAAVQVTTVSGMSATNGCTVVSQGGYGGYQFNVVVYGIDCPSEPVQVQAHVTDHWNDWGGNWCEVKTYTSGYSISGSCNSYTIWRN